MGLTLFVGVGLGGLIVIVSDLIVSERRHRRALRLPSRPARDRGA